MGKIVLCFYRWVPFFPRLPCIHLTSLVTDETRVFLFLSLSHFHVLFWMQMDVKTGRPGNNANPLLDQVVYTCLSSLCRLKPAFQISCFCRLFYSPKRLKRSRTFSSQQEEKMPSVGPIYNVMGFAASSLLAFVTWFKAEPWVELVSFPDRIFCACRKNGPGQLPIPFSFKCAGMLAHCSFLI